MRAATATHGCNAARALRWLFTAAIAGGSLVGLVACGGGDAPPPGAGPITRVEVSATSLLLTGAGQERQLSARAVDGGGGTVDAKVIWSSSAAQQVSVDAQGKVRSVTPIGSALIFAEVDGVRSTPVFVSAVELKPGTLLLRDADIVEAAPPPAPPAGGFPGAGTRYDIWLAGLQAPALGTIVLAVEKAGVSGRVVETAVEVNRVRVRLERLAMPDLLARYDVNWVVDLTAYDIVLDPQTSAAREQPAQARERPLAGTLPEWKIPRAGVQSPCSAQVEAKLQAKPLQVKVAGAPKFEVISSKFDDALPPGRLRVALAGDFFIETNVGLTAEAGLTGEAKCELKGHIPLPFLPVPLNLILKVPVGIGVAASGTVEIASIDIGLSGRNGATFEMGIDCAPPQPCRGLDKAERINEFTPHLEVASAQTEGLKIELEAGAYFLTGIDAVFGIFNASYQFNMLDVKVGPKQKADFGTVKRQADSLPYASSYDLAFVLEVGPGSAIKDAIKELMGGEPADLSFSLKASLPISESPRGTWAPDRTTAVPQRDTVKLNIDLTAFSTTYWKLGYNVEAIEIYRRHESELEFTLMRTLTAVEPKSHFEMLWTPELADAGKNDFAVFAVSKLPVVRLEVGQVHAVQVSCIAATGSARQRPLAAGVCKEEWVGSAAGEITGAQRFKLQDNFVWEQDLLTQLGPNISALRPKQGARSVDVKMIVYENLGCTVSPERFDEFQAALMTVDRNFDPPKYAFSLQIDALITISCPGSPPLTLPTTALSISGLGELTEKGTQMVGGLATPQSSYSWRFDLKVDQPPP